MVHEDKAVHLNHSHSYNNWQTVKLQHIQIVREMLQSQACFNNDRLSASLRHSKILEPTNLSEIS